MRKMFETGEPIPASELLLKHKNGSGVPVFSSHALLKPIGQLPEMFCIDIDLSERRQAQEKLQLAASVFTHAREGILITDADGKIVEVNEAFTRITGYSHEEVIGRDTRILKSGQHEKKFYSAMWRDLLKKGQWYGEMWNKRKSGEIFAVMQTISAVRDAQGRTQNFVALFSDITAIKEHERQLEHIAHFDALTTLPNRVLLADRLQQAMTQARRRGRRLAVAYLDMDGFKTINDRHGHEVGDQLLIALAARMKLTLRQGDTLARMGGDEFVAVLPDLADIESSVPMISRLLAAASHPETLGDHVLHVSASVGVTFYPQTESLDADQLLRQADQAMYQAKLAGKNRYHIFDAEQDRSVRGHHESLEHIRRAIHKNEFVLHYQPKVNMRTGEIIGAEALIRWQHPERGLLAPEVFLPVIEFHPLAVELGEWVISTALNQNSLWRAAGLHIPVSVNLSARHLQQVDFVQRLQEILSGHPTFRPGDLELEVLETSALEDLIRVSQLIEECGKLGVSFALDDFGTGYSSLTYLKRLPVTLVKIDQSFVRDILDDPEDLAILQAMLGLSAVFHRQIIAEGAETAEHCAMLLQLGCDLAQGFGIAHPMRAEDIPGWAATWRPNPAWMNFAETRV
jgi:diguanylate cyclase (GGDEF)-like protein/PAS domain S-box-containing protein